jgi:hypothetical protein
MGKPKSPKGNLQKDSVVNFTEVGDDADTKVRYARNVRLRLQAD